MRFKWNNTCHNCYFANRTLIAPVQHPVPARDMNKPTMAKGSGERATFVMRKVSK